MGFLPNIADVFFCFQAMALVSRVSTPGVIKRGQGEVPWRSRTYTRTRYFDP